MTAVSLAGVADNDEAAFLSKSKNEKVRASKNFFFQSCLLAIRTELLLILTF